MKADRETLPEMVTETCVVRVVKVNVQLLIYFPAPG